MIWLDILLAVALLLIVFNCSAVAATNWLDQSLLPGFVSRGLTCTIAAMDAREYWTRQLREAQAELVAARRRTELNAAAKRLTVARRELRLLEQAPKKARRFNRGSRSAGASA
jgi:hypothetical protein